MTGRRRAPLLACLLLACASTAARAQTLPSQPLSFDDGAVTIGADVSASFGSADPGFFNDTDYEHSALRMLLIDVTGAFKAGDHLSLLGEMRTENADRPQAYGLYARIRPWVDRRLDVQVGRVPPTFGAFARRNYATDNLLIGYPLEYQYLTPLRPDSIPANADELLRMRGRGWQSSFSIGSLTPDRGVPLASVFAWNTGVQVHAANDVVDVTGSLTTGTLSNPRVIDDNYGQQFSGRVAFHPVAGLLIGASASRGPFLTSQVASAAGGSSSQFTQDAWGADVEYSHGYYLVRAEAIVSQWRLPSIEAPFINGPLTAAGISVEGRYKIMPGLYAAARFDHLGFSTITGSGGPATWDAPVTRLEAGGGYSIQRNLLLKLSYQFDTRDTVHVPTANLVATEIVFWF